MGLRQTNLLKWLRFIRRGSELSCAKMGLSLCAQAEALGKNFVQYAIPTRECARPFTHGPPKYSSSERVVVLENSVKKMHG
jgi:hypothetical protein